jgi:PAS domain-containing protein
MVRFEDERDGNWYDTVAYPIAIESGEVTRVAIVARDITERKKGESKIRGINDKSE